MDAVIGAAELSDLIGLIYDCATDPERWPVAMEGMRQALGLHNCSLDLMALPGGESLLNYLTNVPDPWASRIAEHTSAIVGMWGGASAAAALPFTEPLVMSRVVGVPNESWTQPFYVEWAEPQGLCDILGLFLARDTRSVGSLGFGRHRDGPPIDERTISLARLFGPHVQRAAAINRLLDLAALRDATFAALFDTLDAPVLVVDADLKIVHVNRAGRALLNQDSSLRSRGGTLTTGDRGVHSALGAAIRDSTGDITAIGRKGIGIRMHAIEGAPGALHVLPLRPDHPGARRLAAVFVGQAIAPQAAMTEIAGALFGLTPGEISVFEQLAEGCGVNRAAAVLGVAPSTVRTHLQRIYDKTGVRRQAELVRLSNSLAPRAIG